MKFIDPSIAPADAPPILDLDHLLADARWEPLIDLLPDGVLLVDRGGMVRFMNSAAENVTELLRLEVVGRSLAEFVSASKVDCTAALEAFRTGARTNQPVSGRLRRRFLMSTRCVRDWRGALTSFVIVLRDTDVLTRVAAAEPAASLADDLDGHDPPAGAEDDGDVLVLCEATRPLVERGLKAVAMGSRLLLLGESGAGKTELARTLHRLSGAPGRPFIHVNCGSIPESLFESEMFGYERGSFTGALSKGKKGLVEAAEGGVLFLDEIGEIPLAAQAKMLQFLEEGTVHRVGATQRRRLQAQIIVATNRNLAEMVEAGTFRRDLYYRLSVVTLALPPLRQCPEIIDRLVDRMIGRLNRRRPAPLHLDAPARARLKQHPFLGNIRELQHLIEHLAVVCDGTVGAADVERAVTASEPRPTPVAVGAETAPPMSAKPRTGSLKDVVREFESEVIQEAIRRTGSKRKAAEALGVDIATIVRKSRGSTR